MTDSSNRFVEHIMGYLRVYKQSVISSLLKSLIVALALFLPTAYFRLRGADSLSLALRGSSDAFAVSGAIVFGIGALSVLARHGALGGVGYIFRGLWTRMPFSRKRDGWRTSNSPREQRHHRTHRALFFVAVGGFFLLLSLFFSGVYYLSV